MNALTHVFRMYGALQLLRVDASADKYSKSSPEACYSLLLLPSLLLLLLLGYSFRSLSIPHRPVRETLIFVATFDAAKQKYWFRVSSMSHHAMSKLFRERITIPSRNTRIKYAKIFQNNRCSPYVLSVTLWAPVSLLMNAYIS